MSLVAKKAWETRRKKSKKSSEQEPEIVVEQFKRAYRKGQLMRKNKRVEQRKSSVKMDDRMWMYLYGSKWIAYRVLGNGYLSLKKKKQKSWERGGGNFCFFFFFFFSEPCKQWR